MEDFIQDLESIDTKENHLKTFDNLLLVYLISPEANDQENRCQTLMLGIKIRELLM